MAKTNYKQSKVIAVAHTIVDLRANGMAIEDAVREAYIQHRLFVFKGRFRSWVIEAALEIACEIESA